ncbi:uncharacterized protein DNG_09268 [Cephalotrichum gorgonifer]|uniref:NmrA-like domain-containing protein n=1 Tax=Cephalotrichum gorgonifer TaxID=2041049 RepID=A0AAE8N7G1_9PEZI|nr:uncharacterized protein DNG_09268 [Cephalotrichum gorgonifer]
MGTNILVTGAAGYIGGSVVTELLAPSNKLVQKENIFAAVRSEEQATALSKLGITVLRLDLTNESAVLGSVLEHNVGIVIHTASSLNTDMALHLVNALAKQKEVSNQDTYMIQVSGESAFTATTGWPQGGTQLEDIGPLFETEKEFADSFAIRKTDISVTERAKATGVTSFIVIPPMVYGKGTGQWNQLSVLLPIYIQGSISAKAVRKFANDVTGSAAHISDISAFFAKMVEKILLKEPIPSGEKGYYFAKAHDVHWWEVLDRLAVALEARGIAPDSTVQVWSDDETAAKVLGVPVQFVSILWSSTSGMFAANKHQLGWEPVWDKERLLAQLDDEIDAVLELGQAKSSLVSSLDFADEHPQVQVTGTDISPIQLPWVPPNLKFEIEDCTLEWTFPENSMDYIHIRLLFGSITDWTALFKEAYKTCAPGGWVENFESSAFVWSDHEEIPETAALGQWGKIFAEGGKRTGRSSTVLEDNTQQKAIQEAGFVDVQVFDYKGPLGTWPKDPVLKELGSLAQAAWEADIEGYILFIANALGWSKVEMQVFIPHLRYELQTCKYLAYMNQRVVWGRKPGGLGVVAR